MEKNPREFMTDRLVRNIVIGALALLLIGGAYFVNGWLNAGRPAEYDGLLPTALSDRMEFRNRNKDAELPRAVHYENGKLSSAEVPYVSGRIAYIKYFTDGPGVGLIDSVHSYYPQAEGKKERQLEHELVYDTNGKTRRSERVYRTDGSLQYAADRLGEVYQSYAFRQDGHTIEKHQEYSWIRREWSIALAEEYYPNANLAKAVKRLEDGTLDTTMYSEKGALLSHATIDEFKTRALTELYEADGKSLKSRVIESYGSTMVETYVKGVLTEEREFMYGSIQNVPLVMWVTVYDHSGVPLYRQKWVMDYTLAGKVSAKPPVHLESSMYTLSEVQYLNVKKEVTKDIDFQNDGRTPREIVVHDNPPNRHPSTDKTFRGDGTLEKLKVHNADRDVVKVENHEASEGIRETVDEQVLKGRPFDTPLSTLNRVADNGGWEGM